jgi:excisionase family DNA binding protein
MSPEKCSNVAMYFVRTFVLLKITAMEHLVLANISVDELANRIIEKMSLYGSQFIRPLEKNERNEYLSIQEASELIHLAIPTIYGLTHNSSIPHIKKGRKLLFKRSELKEWMDSGRKLTKKEIEEKAMTRIRKVHIRHKF